MEPLGSEPFFMELISGIEETLARRRLSILLHVVPAPEAELEAYQGWAEQGVVDAVVLVNLVEQLGHRRIARVSGPVRLLHTRARTRALVEDCHAAGIEPTVLEGDDTDESGPS